MSRVKFMQAAEAVALIKDDAVVTTGGFIGTAVPEEVLIALEERFLKEQSPQGLTVILAAGQGDGKERGLNHLAHEGLLKRMIAGHWGLTPKVGKLAVENKIEAYNFPQGVIAHLMRGLGAGLDGYLTQVGMGTYVDPLIDGGKVNSRTTVDLVHRVTMGGKERLWFTMPAPTVALLRGTYADDHGNISMEDEALTAECLSQAIATRNAGGTVIVQVRERVANGTIHPKMVAIPGLFVDVVVVCTKPEWHMQTFGTQHNKDYIVASGETTATTTDAEFPLNERKIIARRSALTFNAHTVAVNYGIGMPEVIAQVLQEEDQVEAFTPTVEPGAVGGTPAGGLNFGAAIHPQAIIDQPYMFDFYDGGGLDHAFLGLAQCDQHGNINVSKFGPKFAGCGGFINITQNAKELVFCGTFTAGSLEVAVENGRLRIVNEGKNKKFIKAVEQITFSGARATELKQKVTYITERAVFELRTAGLTLTEVAPGINIEKDILEQMEFKPLMADKIALMDARIFSSAKMGLTFNK